MDYKRVIEAFASGEIDKNDWMVAWDNDGGYWDYIGPKEMGWEERDALSQSMEDKYGQPEGYAGVVDLANAAGIPSTWV